MLYQLLEGQTHFHFHVEVDHQVVASLCSPQGWVEGFGQDQPSVAKRFVPSQFWWKIFKIMISDAESQCCHSTINNKLGEHLPCHMGWKESNVCLWDWMALYNVAA